MRERIEQSEERARREKARINVLAEKRGFRRFSDNEYLDVWVPENQEIGIFPNHFFTTRYDEKGEVVFDEHRIEFPLKDPSELSESLGALNALYSRIENIVVYDRNDPTRFVEFVDGLLEPKQPEV